MKIRANLLIVEVVMRFKKALLPLAISVLFVPSFAVAEDAISGEVTYTQPLYRGVACCGYSQGR